MFSPYLGKEYSDSEIQKEIKRYKDKLLVQSCPNVFKSAAKEIEDGKIVAWFQGRSEYGPRSLGNRSILADPRKVNMKDHINKKVKFREMFRPFAPSVLWEYQKEYFDLDIPSPYMLMVSEIFRDKWHVVPAVTHVDGTGRLQTVMKELNPRFYCLINEFYKLTGVPIVLNTSFNIKGEPIVETPEDAIKCFLGTGIDILFIHDYMLTKNKKLISG